jgi:hypothetical protein
MASDEQVGLTLSADPEAACDAAASIANRPLRAIALERDGPVPT